MRVYVCTVCKSERQLLSISPRRESVKLVPFYGEVDHKLFLSMRFIVLARWLDITQLMFSVVEIVMLIIKICRV